MIGRCANDNSYAKKKRSMVPKLRLGMRKAVDIGDNGGCELMCLHIIGWCAEMLEIEFMSP